MNAPAPLALARQPSALPLPTPPFRTVDEFLTAVFGPCGYLARHFPGYAPRPGQVALARAVYETLERGLSRRPNSESSARTVVAASRLARRGEDPPAPSLDLPPTSIEDDLPPDFVDPTDTTERLVGEAPTGTGKSLAYGIAASYFAWRTEQKIVVATANNALLQQLIGKDLPLVAKLVPWPVRFAALVGRSNYACQAKLYGESDGPPPARQGDLFRREQRHAPQHEQELTEGLDAAERAELARVTAWARETRTGFRGELSPEPNETVWWRVATSSEDCLREGCAHYATCFARHAKTEAEDSGIVVTNFALLFRHIAMRMLWRVDAVLPAHRGLILDEAHEMESYARSGFGAHLTAGTFRTIGRWAERHTRDASTSQEGEQAARLSTEIRQRSEDLFQWVGRYRQGPDYKVRLTRPGWLDPADPAALVAATRAVGDLARAAESRAKRELKEYLERTEGEVADVHYVRALKRRTAEAKNARVRAERAAGWLVEVCTLADGMEARSRRIQTLTASEGKSPEEAIAEVGDPGNGDVYWIETTTKQTRRGPELRVAIEAQPLRVGGLLRAQLWAHPSIHAVVGVSATLRTTAVIDSREGVRASSVETDHGWSHARDHLGIPAGTRALAVASPFNFVAQARLAIPAGMPSPKPPAGADAKAREASDAAYDGAVARVLVEVVKAACGGTLGLFTSKRAMGVARAELAQANTGFNVFVQGDLGRGELVRRFREDVDSVALGVASLGTGVDVPGEALRAVVINKLTFGTPEDPIAHALAAYWEARGERSFDKETLPAMLLVLRQWVGRLVRDTRDVGFVVLCDPRAATGTYARKVQQAIGWPVVRNVGEAAQWLAEKRNGRAGR